MEDIAFHWLYDVMDQCNGNSFLLLLLMNHTEDPQQHLQIQVDNTIKKINKKNIKNSNVQLGNLQRRL